MTYCCGILVREGLVMIADTRTNAGVDNVSTYRKLHRFIHSTPALEGVGWVPLETGPKITFPLCKGIEGDLLLTARIKSPLAPLRKGG